MRLACLLLTTLVPAVHAPAQFIEDLRGPARVDYLVVAADDLARGCLPLVAHRQATGLETALVRFGDVCRAYGDGRAGPEALVAFLAHAHGQWGVRFVLLVGDARGTPGASIPMPVEPARYHTPQFASSPDIATDHFYATLGGEQTRLHVGRFPVSTLEHLAAVVNKTIRYETGLRPGPWQRRVAFVAGPFGDPVLDPVLEAQFSRMAATAIPPAYDVEVAYARLQSPYAVFPPSFSANALRLLNDGALFHVYVGHATRTGYDDLLWMGRRYPILDLRGLAAVHATEGLPVMVAVACWTGILDAEAGEGLGEALLRLPRGPVAFLGASRICQPYGNVLLGRGLMQAAFSHDLTRLGEVVSAAKDGVLGPDDSDFRRQADGLASLIQGPAALQPIRLDTVRHYNLLGDPALVLQRPRADVEVEVTREGNHALLVTSVTHLDHGAALVSLEVPRDRFTAQPGLPPAEDAPDLEALLAERYGAANEKAVVRMEAAVTEGRLQVTLPLPAGLPAGEYVVKVMAWDDHASAVGALVLDLWDGATAP